MPERTRKLRSRLNPREMGHHQLKLEVQELRRALAKRAPDFVKGR